MDSLKSVCEGALKPAINADNVLVLLSVGDQYNAASLRVSSTFFRTLLVPVHSIW